MIIALFILGGFALLTAVVDFFLFLHQKKRIDQRFAAMCSLLESNLDSVHCQFDSVTESVSKLKTFLTDIDTRLVNGTHDFRLEMDTVKKDTASTADCVLALAKRMEELQRVCTDLQLDYQEAQKAASRVNDFASGLANIFDYDPVAQLKRAREGGRTE
jgi:hypothetical protein|nr:MAG TPA_asm: hypothetical protein [Caudoviricetes sp.]